MTSLIVSPCLFMNCAYFGIEKILRPSNSISNNIKNDHKSIMSAIDLTVVRVADFLVEIMSNRS